MTTCYDIMTKAPVCCLPSDTANHVARLMEHGNFGSVPVVQNHQTKELVGIVTDRDLALRVVGEGRDSHERIEAVMTPTPWVCQPQDLIEVAVDIMAQVQIRRVLVVDDNRRILGVISQADIATRHAKPAQTAQVVEQISQPDSHEVR